MTNEREALHVVFGAGPVGLAIADELVSRGHRVRLVNRSGRPPAVTDAPEVEWVSADAMDPAAAAGAAVGAAVVYFALNHPYDRWPELFPPMQANVLAATQTAGARLVAMENVYMYGPTVGAPLTEALPSAATTKKGRVRAAMHNDLIAAHARGDVAVAVGRASDFVGPRVLESAMGSRVAPAVIAGKKAQLIGDVDLPQGTRTCRTSGRRSSRWASVTRRSARPGTSPRVAR